MSPRATDERTAVAAVEALLLHLYIGDGAGGGGAPPGLRLEDRKKAREVAALLDELRGLRRGLVVDAAAGHGYVGLLAARLLGLERLVMIERDPGRAERCRQAAALLGREGLEASLEVHAVDVGDEGVWPRSPDIAVALHACGAAADAVLDAATAAGARHLLLVPCCYGDALPFAERAAARAEALGIPRQAEVRRRFLRALVDAERTLRLEAAGYEVKLVSFVPESVTPHNLLFRARRVGEPRRAAEAAAQLARLRTTP